MWDVSFGTSREGANRRRVQFDRPTKASKPAWPVEYVDEDPTPNWHVETSKDGKRLFIQAKPGRPDNFMARPGGPKFNSLFEIEIIDSCIIANELVAEPGDRVKCFAESALAGIASRGRIIKEIRPRDRGRTI